MLGRRFITAGMAVAIATATLAGCGNDSDDPVATPSGSIGTGSTTAPAPTGSVPTGSPIVLGTICSCSGVQASAIGRADQVYQAWASSVNDAGGINGHPVKVIAKDDGGDPAKALQLVKSMVEQDKIIALADISVVDPSFADYLSQKGVPVVGGNSFQPPFLTDPNFFVSGSILPVMFVGLTKLTEEAGKKQIASTYCAESPVCATVTGLLGAAKEITPSVDFTATKLSSSAPNYDAVCLKARSEGADTLLVGANPVTAQRVVDNCARLRFKALVINTPQAFAPALLKDPAFEGAIYTIGNAPHKDTSIPAVKASIDALNRYFPGLAGSGTYTSLSATAWNAGKLFEAASKAAGGFSSTSTPADVKRGLYALKDETLDGLAPPLNFTEGRPGFPNCYFSFTIKSEQVAPNGTEPDCLTAGETTMLQTSLAKLFGG